MRDRYAFAVLLGWYAVMTAVHVYMLSTYVPTTRFAHNKDEEGEAAGKNNHRELSFRPVRGDEEGEAAGSSSLLSPPVVLAFKNVDYFVPVPGRKDEELQLLKGVSRRTSGPCASTELTAP